MRNIATTSSQGVCLTTGPIDVCKTPSPGGPVPIPYPNIGRCADGSGSSKVKIQGKQTLRKGDKLSKSNGDNAGTLGGVKSNRFMGNVVLKMGNGKVKIEGKEAAHHLSPTEQNNGNTVGVQMILCQ